MISLVLQLADAGDTFHIKQVMDHTAESRGVPYDPDAPKHLVQYRKYQKVRVLFACWQKCEHCGADWAAKVRREYQRGFTSASGTLSISTRMPEAERRIECLCPMCLTKGRSDILLINALEPDSNPYRLDPTQFSAFYDLPQLGSP